MRYSIAGLSVLLAVFMILAVPGVAEVPHLVNIQGRAIDASQQPLDGDQTIKFKIYGSAAGTDSLWSSGDQTVPVEDGLFSYQLGSKEPLPATLFAGGATRWLGITIGKDPELAPRTQLIAVPYAYHAESSDTATYALASPTSSSPWIDDGTSIRLANINDSVGIGVVDPGVKLEVAGGVTAIMGHTAGSGLAAGVMGINENTGYGVMGMSTGGRGVFGTTVSGFGGYFWGPKNYFSGHLGIGTEAPEQMLHVYEDGSGTDAYVQIEAANGGNFGETGIRFKNPENSWRFFMEDVAYSEIPAGGIGLYSDAQLSYPAMSFMSNSDAGFGTPPFYDYQVSIGGHPNALYAFVDGGGTAVYASSGSGFGIRAVAPKNYFSGRVGFGTDDPTHTVTVNGSMGFQTGGTTAFHLGYYSNGLNISETTVADYRLYIREGGNVGIGTSNPTTRLYVAGSFHADSFESNAIGRANIRDEVGIASAPTDASVQSLTSSWKSYLSREITVPTAGYVLALGCADLFLLHDVSGTTQAKIAFSDSPTTAPSVTQGFFLGSSVNEGNIQISVPTQRLFYCSSAGTYTYYLVGIETGDNPCSISREKMDLIFIPTVYASKDGLLADAGDDALAELTSAEIAEGQSTEAIPPATADQSNSEGMALLKAEIQALKDRLAEVEKK